MLDALAFGSWFYQRRDTQHNDTQYNDTQYNDTQYNDTQYNDTQHKGLLINNQTVIMLRVAFLFIVMLSVVALMSSQWIQSASTFYCQLAAWVPDMLMQFYLMKINEISNNSIITRRVVTTESGF
jgi:hypothetical protein